MLWPIVLSSLTHRHDNIFKNLFEGLEHFQGTQEQRCGWKGSILSAARSFTHVQFLVQGKSPEVAGKSQRLSELWGMSRRQKGKHTRIGLLRQIVVEGLGFQRQGGWKEVIPTFIPSFPLEGFDPWGFPGQEANNAQTRTHQRSREFFGFTILGSKS